MRIIYQSGLTIFIGGLISIASAIAYAYFGIMIFAVAVSKAKFYHGDTWGAVEDYSGFHIAFAVSTAVTLAMKFVTHLVFDGGGGIIIKIPYALGYFCMGIATMILTFLCIFLPFWPVILGTASGRILLAGTAMAWIGYYFEHLHDH
jgi:hypothetical protein